MTKEDPKWLMRADRRWRKMLRRAKRLGVDPKVLALENLMKDLNAK